MPGRSDETAGRRRRAPAACDFCRHRKMKCDNEKPLCRNCKEHGKDCAYAELIKKPRPSIARITRLEQENQQLRERFARLEEQNKSADEPSNTPSSIGVAESLFRPATGEERNANCEARSCSRPFNISGRPPSPSLTSHSNKTSVARWACSPDKESWYHGPTSALFDEKSTETRSNSKSKSTEKAQDVWIERQLVAESASQRQLETVNFISGRLDFDGVDPKLGLHLLSIYWNRQHSLGPVVYRTAFMRDMACNGPSFSKLLLNAIYFFASKYTSKTEVRRDPDDIFTAGYSYRQRATELLDKSFSNSSMTTIQALLIFSNALFSWCDEKSASWLYSGMAFNMIVDLGINVNASTLNRSLSEEDLEIRRRVFWAAYVVDKLQSLYQGRPTRLHESDTNLPMAFMDKHEELELFSPLSYTENSNSPVSPVYSISIFKELCKLSIILDKILLSNYAENSGSRDPVAWIKERDLLHSALENWRHAFPQHLDVETAVSTNKDLPLPHILSLLIMFNVVVILLHRPFVTGGHLNSAPASIAHDAFSVCSAAALKIDKILRLYEQSFCLKTTPYIVSYGTYVSATIHVRLAAQKQPGSDAHKALRKCLDILDIHQTVCWAPWRAKRVINRLIGRMGVVLDERDSTTSNLMSENPGINTTAKTAPSERTPAASIDFTCTSVQQVSNTTSFNDDFVGHLMPLTSDEFSFLYDPIFGFNGSAFDDLNFEIGGDVI